MDFKIKHLVLILILMLAVHIYAIHGNMYTPPGIWIDNPLHLLGGLVLGITWLLFVGNHLQKMPKWMIMLSTVSFAAFGSLLWEIFELTMTAFFSELAQNGRFYSPTVLDAVKDMSFGAIGGLIIGLTSRKKNGKS